MCVRRTLNILSILNTILSCAPFLPLSSEENLKREEEQWGGKLSHTQVSYSLFAWVSPFVGVCVSVWLCSFFIFIFLSYLFSRTPIFTFSQPYRIFFPPSLSPFAPSHPSPLSNCLSLSVYPNDIFYNLIQFNSNEEKKNYAWKQWKRSAFFICLIASVTSNLFCFLLFTWNVLSRLESFCFVDIMNENNNEKKVGASATPFFILFCV